MNKEKEKNTESKVWLTSDLHLGHTNIIKYSNRPFKNVHEMNEALINNWNSNITSRDRVYLLGDVCFQHPKEAKKTLDRLMGQIYLIKGNHDRDGVLQECKERFVWIKDYFELTHNGQKMILCHYPLLTWNGCHRGTWNLHGHCHGSLPDSVNTYARRLDVGVDVHNYMPISFEYVKNILDKKEFRPVDHHGQM